MVWTWCVTLLLFLTIIGGLAWNVRLDQKRFFVSSRNFFGVTHILQPGNKIRVMEHGRTVHGTQFLTRGMRGEPTTYYERDSGIGIALAEYRRLQMSGKDNDTGLIQTRGSGSGSNDNTLRIGVIGLGTGTIAALTQPGDTLRYYEIDPDVERLARRYFTYINDSAAMVDVILGDARIILEHQAQNDQYQNFDVLVVDAFNSDAVPMHLLTREAMELYFTHLKPHGLLAFHVTNRYLNLGAVVRGLAENTDKEVVRIHTSGTGILSFDTQWVIMTNNPSFLARESIRVIATEWSNDESLPILWTDEYASLWRALAANKGAAEGKWGAAPNKGQFVLDEARLIAVRRQNLLDKVLPDLRDTLAHQVG